MLDRELGHYVNIGTDLRKYRQYSTRLPRKGLERLRARLNGRPSGRILALSGLRLTGKTTMLLQALRGLSDAEMARTARVFAATLHQPQLLEILDALRGRGMTRVIIDGLTDMEGFTGVAPLERYAEDMVLAVAGADTLYFRLETASRLDVLHMTHIPAREYMRLHGATVQQCFQLGGMACPPEKWDAPAHDLSSDYFMRCQVSGNIRRSLVRAGRMREWAAMGQEEWLRNGIPERVLRHVNRQTMFEAAAQGFLDRDLSRPAASVARECAVSGGTARTALKLLETADFLVRVREETPERRNGWRWLPVQPGLRWLQATENPDLLDSEALPGSGGDIRRVFGCFTCQDMQTVRRIVNDRLLLDLVLLDTVRAALPNVSVRSLLLPGHQRGMLVADRRCLLAGEAVPVTIPAGRFLLRAASHDAAAMELVEEHIGAAILRKAGLPAPETRLGRCQGLVALLAPRENRAFTPAPVPVLAGSHDIEAQVRAMDRAAAWAARYGVEESFWKLAGMDGFLGNHDRPCAGWGVTRSDSDGWRLVLPRGNRARLLRIPRGRDSMAQILLDALGEAVFDSVREDALLRGLGQAARFLRSDPVGWSVKALAAPLLRQRFITAAEEAFWREAVDDARSDAGLIADRIHRIEDEDY